MIGTAKDAGILVYDLSGRLVQAMFPPNAPQVLDNDPDDTSRSQSRPWQSVRGQPESGETFGRYNNVDIAYDVRLGKHSRAPRADVAIVSDRGCDRVRFFKIDPGNPDGPLIDITSTAVPRVFPRRYEQPSVLQPSGAVEGWIDNPVDDQNTVYGLTVVQGHAPTVFVSQRERGLVRQLIVEPSQMAGSRTVSFEPSCSIRASTSWTRTVLTTNGLPAARRRSKSLSPRDSWSTVATTRCTWRSRRSGCTGCLESLRYLVS